MGLIDKMPRLALVQSEGLLDASRQLVQLANPSRQRIGPGVTGQLRQFQNQ